MLLDGETFDLVQHIDTVLAAVRGPRARAAHQRRADAVGARDRDAGLPHAGRRRASSYAKLRGYVCDVAREQGLRVGSAGTHPFSLFERQRITAKDRYRALVDQLQYIARRELIFGHARARRRRRRGEGDPGRERADRAPRRSSWRSRRARRSGAASRPGCLVAAHGVRRVPALRPAAALPRLRRLRRGRRPARAHRLHRRLHAHLVGHPAAPAARHDRDPDLRRRHAARRRRSRSPRSARRSSSTTPSGTTPARRSRRTTGSSRPRTSGSPPATGSRRRSWTSSPAGGTASRSRSSSAAR